jgi:O-antigen ligase
MVTKAPIFGTGIRATRFKSKDLIEKRAAKREPGDSTLPARLGRHAHNHFLQIWYELGAVGAALFLALGLALLRLIKGLSGPVRPYAHAAFSAACVIAAFGWGLWQTWLLAGYALAIVLIGLAACFSRSQEI